LHIYLERRVILFFGVLTKRNKNIIIVVNCHLDLFRNFNINLKKSVFARKNCVSFLILHIPTVALSAKTAPQFTV
jgi:hypothetical protein